MERWLKTPRDDSLRTFWSVPANGTSELDVTRFIYTRSFNHSAVSVSRNTTSNPGNHCPCQTGPTGDQILIGMELLPEWVSGLICCLSLDLAIANQLLPFLSFICSPFTSSISSEGSLRGFMVHHVALTRRKTRWGRRTSRTRVTISGGAPAGLRIDSTSFNEVSL